MCGKDCCAPRYDVRLSNALFLDFASFDLVVRDAATDVCGFAFDLAYGVAYDLVAEARLFHLIAGNCSDTFLIHQTEEASTDNAAALPLSQAVTLSQEDTRKTERFLTLPTAVTQRLLEHSAPQLTNQVYTNVDAVLRQAINLLPVAEWV